MANMQPASITVTLPIGNAIGRKVGEEMLKFLLTFDPVGSMTVADVKTIARFAQGVVLKEFADKGLS